MVSAGRGFPLLWSPRGGRRLHLPRVTVRPQPLEVQGCRSQRAQGPAVPVPMSHLYAQLRSQPSMVPTTNPDEKRVVCGVSTRGDLASHRGSLQEEKPWEQGGSGGSSSDRALGGRSHPASISRQAQSHAVTLGRVSHSFTCCAERVREEPAPAVWHLLSIPYSFSLLYRTGQPEHSAPPPPEPTPPLTRGELLHVPFASWALLLAAWAGASLGDPFQHRDWDLPFQQGRWHPARTATFGHTALRILPPFPEFSEVLSCPRLLASIPTAGFPGHPVGLGAGSGGIPARGVSAPITTLCRYGTAPPAKPRPRVRAGLGRVNFFPVTSRWPLVLWKNKPSGNHISLIAV